MANVAYVRVSTIEQNDARQREALEACGIDRWFIEKVSAKDTKRPELQRMLEYVREGDSVYIHELSRLARNTKDLLEIVETFEKKGVHLVCNRSSLDTSTANGKLMLTMLGAIAEFERSLLLERQREGIAIAKGEGKYKGRHRIAADRRFEEAYAKYMKRELSKATMSKELNVSRPTLDRMIREHKAI